MTPAEERWLPIPGVGDYTISSAGRVYSAKTNRLMKPTPGIRGHMRINLQHPGGKKRMHYVHRLVMLAFVGPCPDGMEVCHNDGNPANNSRGNLRYGTRSENALDRLIHVVKDNPERIQHCLKGLHPLLGANVYVRPDTGKRQCRACIRASERARVRS